MDEPSGTTTQWTPTVDVLVCALNEERHLARCLRHVVAQDYPSELVRIWVVDSGSTDASVEVARACARSDDRVTVVADGRRRNLPEALNLGIALSSGEIVAKIDAHGFPEHDFITAAIRALGVAPDDVACVGGRPLAEGETPFARALVRARASRFGVGGSEYAGRHEQGFVTSVGMGVYKRAALAAIGGFDPDMPYGEDDEINWRLRDSGHRILLDSRLRYHYTVRRSWLDAFLQYRNYGRSRVRVVRKHPGFLRPYHALPAAAVAVAGACTAAAPWSRPARRGLALGVLSYATAAAVAARRASPRASTADTALILSAFVALHSGYGLGTLEELARRIAARASKAGAVEQASV